MGGGDLYLDFLGGASFSVGPSGGTAVLRWPDRLPTSASHCSSELSLPASTKAVADARMGGSAPPACFLLRLLPFLGVPPDWCLARMGNSPYPKFDGVLCLLSSPKS